MRKIEQAMVRALQARVNWRERNTAVELDKRQDGKPLALVYLHGNHIATIGYESASDPFDGRPYPVVANVSICLAGWNTVTTRSRLSAIICAFAAVGPHGLGVSTCRGQPRLHDSREIRDIGETTWHGVELRA